MKTCLLLIAGLMAACALPAAAGTLETVRGRGEMICGVSPGVAGFSVPDEAGRWGGFDVDICRAVAAAVLGDAGKVRYTPLSPKDRFVSLQSGEIDMLSRQATWTLSRDTQMGLRYVGVGYYDGQGFMVRKALNIKSARELNGASVCVPTGTTTELNIADYFRANGMKYEGVAFEAGDQVAKAFESGRCDVFSNDVSALSAYRLKLVNMKYEGVAFEAGDQVAKAFESGRCDVFSNDVSALSAYRLKLVNPTEYVILPELISKEPLGPVVRQGDETWTSIVRWSLYAMLVAEELGVTSANAEEQKRSGSPEVQRLLGATGNLGESMGLKPDWALQIIKQVGNYGEVYERNVGSGSKLGIERGLNKLWTKGGLQYAPPVR